MCFPGLKAWAQNKGKLQLNLGDRISIYSEKAYRKDEGTYFEAVGNVVIKSGADTVYGQKASFNFKTGLAEVEGNVRYIGEGITLYGSSIAFNSSNGMLELEHARIITQDFNIIANKLKKVGPDQYEAFQAEFTTCHDCVESWTIYGDRIELELAQYIKIHNAMLKIKGINILYFPFIALPVKNKRESGLLFPSFYTQNNEGLSYKQPVYWAINDSKDMTFTPGFLGKRGYAFDLEYRQMFSPMSWVDYTHFFVNDNIYRPGKDDLDVGSGSYFRNFVDIESHYQWSHDLNQHFRFTQTKDLDFMLDFPSLTDDRVNNSDVGFEGHLDRRFDHFSLGFEAGHRTNVLVADSETRDKTYVQILPRVHFSTIPYVFFQNDRDYLQNLVTGIDSDFTVFKQNETLEDNYIRNANRLDVRPYLTWQWLNYGPLQISSAYRHEYQDYQFHSDDQEGFQKSAGVFTTEFAFSMERIFGIAYEKEIPLNRLTQKSAETLASNLEQNEVFADKNFIGQLPSLQSFLKDDTVKVRRNSYRHSQEFKIIHYMLANSRTKGNEVFEGQISDRKGWFDYRDAILADLSTVGTNATRQVIPKKNTLELQWNNDLIKKSPRTYNYFQDNEYLRDHFSYNKIGFFNLSQGVVLTDQESEDFSERLTRLFLDTGYTIDRWKFGMKEYFFHQTADHIFTLNTEHGIGKASLLAAYNYNSIETADLKTIKAGAQYRPMDTFGMSVLREYDLNADKNLRTIVQFDIMPNNNCWIFNLNYRESLVQRRQSRISFNIVFNFGDEKFSEYRNNFFNFDRLQ